MDRDGLAFAFAALGEPGGQALGKAFGREAETGFEFAVSEGEGVVEVGGVGEIPHAELVEQIERTGAGFTADDNIYVEFLGVHKIKRGRVKTRPLQFRATLSYEARGRLTEWASPTASSIQMKYQPMSV